MAAMSSVNDTVDWRQARQWLIDSGVIPPTHRVTKPDVALVDFARSLRDGVFLCSLLNRLKQGCVEYTARPVMQHSYLHNINAFLTACKIHFHIKENDLFTDSELYDVDNFSKVMLALSKLSHTQQAYNMGWKPFPNDDNKFHYNEVNEGDIYASLQEVSAQTAVYANIQDLYQESPSDDDSFGYGDEKIYDSICYYEAAPIKENDHDEKKRSIIKELYETEKSFVSVLETISVDYYDALKEQTSLEDLKQLFEISQSVLPFHLTLKDGLGSCAESKSGDVDVAQVFFDAEDGLLQYGLYAAYLPEAQEKAKFFQTKSDTCKVMSVTMEKHHQRFPLSDLLPVPIQRILRYPLLVKDLEKSTKKCAKPSQIRLQQLEKLSQLLEDIGKYINVTKEHFEKMRAIRELEANISSEYKGPKLSSECGHYHMDGELRIKLVDGGPKSDEPRSRWVFLFDKLLLITSRKYRLTKGMSYTVKAHHNIADITLVDPPMSALRAKTHSFRIRVEGKEPCEYIAYAKTDQLKFKWRDSINKAREVISPKAGKKGHHVFDLVTFDTPKKCSYCLKLLYGCYFQGYKCTECNVVSHGDCLEKQQPCSSVRPIRPPHPPHPPVTSQSSVDRFLQQKKVNGSAERPEPLDPKQRRLYYASQRYNAIGPRRDTFLSFEKGDEILAKESDHDWWEGIVVKTGQRGLVSPNYLSKQKIVLSREDALVITRRKLSEYPWYIGMKTRIDAEVALHRSLDGVYLIRESWDRPGEYAVALKWNGMPKHIKIMKNQQTERFYVSDACDFESISDLVEYYQKNTLGVSFPGVDTTLRYPYSEVPVERSLGPHDRRHPSLSGPGLNPPPNFPAPHPQNPSVLSPPPSMWVEAVCDFEGDGAGQLSFQKHDHVKVLSRDTQRLGWWLGECNGKTGVFRSDHIIPMN